MLFPEIIQCPFPEIIQCPFAEIIRLLFAEIIIDVGKRSGVYPIFWVA